MIIPIHAWEYQLSAEIIRTNLRTRQAKVRGILGVQILDDILSGISWRVCEHIGAKLGGEKLPR